MKKMKKLVGLLLAAIMVLAMTTAVSAATISAPAGSTHTYEVYQIFTGDYSGGILSNVKWGQNSTGTAGEAVADDVLAALTAVNSASDTAKLEVIETYVNLDSTPFKTVTAASPATDVPNGYYLIKDQDGPALVNDAYTLYVTQVVGNDITIEPKVVVPTVEKKVKDINDSGAAGETDWQDSADYDMRDSVPFQLKAILGDRLADYNTYKLVFHDTLSAGLTYDNNAKVYLNGTEVTSGYEISSAGTSLTITFDDVKADAVGAKVGDIITVEYTATLNENAVIGSAGNPNEVYLEYSNNPNGEGIGTTTPDKVIVFTFQTVVNKVTKNPNYKEGDDPSTEYIPLKGAGFTLYKKNAQDTYDKIGVELIGTAEEPMTTFTFKGLDDGDYKLEETTTPAGYNTIAPIEFTITAEHDVLADTPALTSLSGLDASGTVTFTAEAADGSLTTDVVNNSGATLPTTGGMGTTIFYVLGTILVLGAAILLITKKRTAEVK